MSEYVVRTVAGQFSVARIMEPRRYDPATGELVSTVIMFDSPESLLKLANQLLSEYVKGKSND